MVLAIVHIRLHNGYRPAAVLFVNIINFITPLDQVPGSKVVMLRTI